MHEKLATLVGILVCAAVTASAASTPDRWVEARSKHFIVLTNSGVRDASRVATQFERMHQVFHKLLPTKGDESNPPVMVLALKDRRDLQALEPETYLSKKQVDLAGFFLRAPEKDYILMRLDAHEEHRFAAVYHEYTHYMLRKVGGWLPLWLNEGLAEFYENTDIGGKYVWLGEANAEKIRDLRLNDLLPIATLFRVDSNSPYYHDEKEGSIFYAESWALTHYLIVSDRIMGTHHLRDYTEYLMEGEDGVMAAQHAFGSLKKLDEELGKYVLQRNFTFFAMGRELPLRDAPLQVVPVSTTKADAVRADVLVYMQRTKEAEALLNSVLRADPDNAQAHESMGLLRYRDGDIAGAKKWYGEAVGLDSQSYLAHYYLASMTLRDGGSSEDEAIEANLQTSIKLNADFAPSYDALAMFYASRRGMLKEAHELNLRAIELAPDRLSFRLHYAAILTDERQFANALDALKAAEPLAKSVIEIDAVESRMERLKRDQASQGNPLGRAGD